MSFYSMVEAQNVEKKVSFSLKAGVMFTSFQPSNFGRRKNEERYNKWNIELGLENKRLGIGGAIRYMTLLGLIPNPLYKAPKYPAFDINTVKTGDLIYIAQKYEDFSFLLNKRVGLIGNKHRFDYSLGIQLRSGTLYFFSHYFGPELHTTYQELDKYGIISRIGYTYLISKHFSVSTNVEYSRFKMKPADFWDFNVLAGFRF